MERDDVAHFGKHVSASCWANGTEFTGIIGGGCHFHALLVGLSI